jgi:hypothetical protein
MVTVANSTLLLVLMPTFHYRQDRSIRKLIGQFRAGDSSA